jgi:oligopeptidase A
MYSKEYFVVKETDQEDFKKALDSYKNWLESYIVEQKGVSISKFIEDNNKQYAPLEALFNKYSYLTGIQNTDVVAKNFENMITEYQQFSNPMGQSEEYFKFTDSLTTDGDVEERLKERYLKSFKDSGLNLDKESQSKLNNLKEKLSKASLKYSDNIIKSKKEWSYELSDDLSKELTEEELALFIEVDGKKVLKFNQNVMGDILVKSKSPEFKRIIHEAFKYPASSKSNFDNTEITNEILSLKQSIAQTLGYNYYTEMALKDRMAGSYETVSGFLNKIKNKMKPLAHAEYLELNKFILEDHARSDVEKWERGYYANLKKEKELNYKFNMERPYFPQNKVFEGVYSLINKLFGFTFVKDTESFILPYEDTECYKVYEGEKLKAYLLVDMYERPLKRAGAWVSGMSGITENNVGLIGLCCNINKNDVGLDISEINTLLHEFGHAVHHFSSKVKFDDMAGTSGMARDAVEIPSQMLEQYAYNRDYLESLSSHIETGEKITSEMLDSIIKSKNYGIGSFYARQLVLALFDITVYHDFKGDITQLYKDIVDELLPVKVDEDTNFPNVFSHIFDGGYSAGYYGYMWADIYSIDAYTYVLENEIENANKFKVEFLAKGSSQDAKEIYEVFRGKEVDEDSFLAYYGLN